MKRLTGLFLVLAIMSCRSVSEGDVDTFSQDAAKIMTEVTSVVAYDGDPIRIRFAQPVGDADVAKIAGAVSFTPRFAYDLSWDDTRTLSATPRTGLVPGARYVATVDLAKIVGADGADLAPVSFSFRALGNEISQNGLRLESVDGGFVLAGSLDFARPVTPDAVRKAVDLRIGRAGTAFDITSEDEVSTSFRLVSDLITRGDSARTATLSVAPGPVGLESGYAEAYTVPPAGEFTAVSVDRVDDTGYRISLSDRIDTSGSLAGLVRTVPDVDPGIRVDGRDIYLLGDFEPGTPYSILVSSQVQSEHGRRMMVDQQFDVVAPDLDPQIEYLSSGVYMPSSNLRTLGFRTLNIKAVTIRVQRVFENNLGQFLQTETLASEKRRTQYFNYSYMNRVGVDIYNEKVEIGDTRNEWVVSGIDLSDVFDDQPKGLYVLSLRYDQEDIVTKGSDYYYRYWESTIFKPVVETDLGVTYKNSPSEHLVFVADLVDAKPMPDVNVRLMTYQNQVIAEGVTDSRGFASFENRNDPVFYVVAETGSQRAAIKLNEMSWNVSSFETGGVERSSTGTQGFLYTDRGVYRPGDPIRLSVILRNSDGTFPEGHPVQVNWYDPRGRLIDVYHSNDGIDGFYHFELMTDTSDPTGEWRAEVEAGGTTFNQPLQVETIVPYKLKVRIEPSVESVTRGESTLEYDIASEYLFGAPAAGLQAESTITLDHVSRKFPGYPGYSFDNEAVGFTPVRDQVFSGMLDADGKASTVWRVPYLGNAPSALDAAIQVRVFEKGGRPNSRTVHLPVEAYDRYIGVEKPDLPYGYVRLGNEISVRYILVDTEGEAVPDRPIYFRIFRNERHWWWEYDSREDFRLHYKSDVSTRLVFEGAAISGITPASFSYIPEDWGEYYVEVSDGDVGHTAGFFFRASWWGAAPSGSDDASLLALRTDKKQYAVGETARVTFPSPPSGTIMMSVENREGILDTRVVSLDGASEETTLDIELTSEMTPNVYIALSLVQPHSQSLNDRPLRLYGVVPIRVEDPATHRELRIETDEVFAPNKPFEIRISTTDNRRTQFTLAVVDEGLLDITGFATPDPWNSFYAKQRLSVTSYDTYSHVIGANSGDFFRVFSVGGGYDQGAYAGGEANERQFDTVALFSGPMFTDQYGRATVRFEMPNYMGSVRIMAVAADGKAYGKAEKTVPVKEELLLLPSYPRVLGPVERFEIPVTVFNLSEGVASARVSISTRGPVAIEGETIRTVSFDGIGERDIVFVAATAAEVGTASFTIRAVSLGASATHEVNIPVRAASPRVSRRTVRVLDVGESIELAVPGDGIAGTNEASIHISSRPDLDLGHRLRWLIRYPYGCIEQTTSSVFPQLFLKGLIAPDEIGVENIDTNINAAIERLRRFQTPSGGFSYWPGGDSVSVWGTNYAGHFLVEARRLGYYVPDDLYTSWIRYQTSRATSSADGLMERVYRVYLLALAGSPSQAAMNVLYETNLEDMTDPQRWLLAEAYLLRGMESTAAKIVAQTGFETEPYDTFGPSYGSPLRDRAMMLEALVLFGRWSEAEHIFRDIAADLSSPAWLSTQTTGYSLLALGKFMQAHAATSTPQLSGAIEFAGRVVRFDTTELSVSIPIDSGFGEKARITMDAASGFERSYVTLEWSGIPLRGDAIAPVSGDLSVAVSYYDDYGRAMDPGDITQGSDFWMVFRAGKNVSTPLTDLALVSILPSGWEVENIRLSGEELPNFLLGRTINEAEYLDIRDDRVMWFFDLSRYERSREFAMKVNAVTSGTFYMPQVTFESMYDSSYYATSSGREVTVRSR